MVECAGGVWCIDAHVGVVNGASRPFGRLFLAQTVFDYGLEVPKILRRVGSVRRDALCQLHRNPVALVVLIGELDGFGGFSGLKGVEEEKQVRINLVRTEQRTSVAGLTTRPPWFLVSSRVEYSSTASSNPKLPEFKRCAMLSISLPISANASGSTFGDISTWQALYTWPRRSVTRKKW